MSSSLICLKNLLTSEYLSLWILLFLKLSIQWDKVDMVSHMSWMRWISLKVVALGLGDTQSSFHSEAPWMNWCYTEAGIWLQTLVPCLQWQPICHTTSLMTGPEQLVSSALFLLDLHSLNSFYCIRKKTHWICLIFLYPVSKTICIFILLYLN